MEDVAGLLTYGTDFAVGAKLAADCVNRILKGAKPNELPVQTVHRHTLVVNLKTAQALSSAGAFNNSPTRGAQRGCSDSQVSHFGRSGRISRVLPAGKGHLSVRHTDRHDRVGWLPRVPFAADARSRKWHEAEGPLRQRSRWFLGRELTKSGADASMSSQCSKTRYWPSFGRPPTPKRRGSRSTARRPLAARHRAPPCPEGAGLGPDG